MALDEDEDYYSEEQVEVEKAKQLQHTDRYRPPTDAAQRWMTDYTLLYEQIKAQLKGGTLYVKEDGNYVISYPKIRNPQTGKLDVFKDPYMNDRGIELTMAEFRMLVNKIGGLSNFSEPRIMQITKFLADSLSELYLFHMDDFDLREEKADAVIDAVCLNVEANLRKSLNGMSSYALANTEKIVERIGDEGNKGGLSGVAQTFGKLGVL